MVAGFVNEEGDPLTGATPTITIRKVLDNTVLINSASMTEIGNGFYKYNFATYSSTIAYTFLCDSGVDMSGRYAMSTSVIDLEDKVDAIQDTLDDTVQKGVISFDSTE